MSVNVTATAPSQISWPPEHKAKVLPIILQHSVSLLPVQIHFSVFSSNLNQFHNYYYLKNCCSNLFWFLLTIVKFPQLKVAFLPTNSRNSYHKICVRSHDENAMRVTVITEHQWSNTDLYIVWLLHFRKYMWRILSMYACVSIYLFY